MTPEATTALVISSKDDLYNLLHTVVGPCAPIQISQERIDQFAAATGDHQWIHTDPERAKDGPFGTTIAHGYLTLSLAPGLLEELIDLSGASMAMNYGCDKVRFPSTVPVDSMVSMTVELKNIDDTRKGLQCLFELTFTVEGSAKPVCVADVIYLIVF